MIHLLEVSPKLTIKDLKKLARKYAMTGGFEIGLQEGLTPNELDELADIHIPELAAQRPDLSTYRTNNSYRILNLIYQSPDALPETKSKIAGLLAAESLISR